MRKSSLGREGGSGSRAQFSLLYSLFPGNSRQRNEEKEEPERLDSGTEGTELIPDLPILH